MNGDLKDFARYEKQVLFKPIGLAGQKKLAKAKIGIVGSGALGSNLANILTRSGIGHILLVDRDRVELSNLQRQMLFTEKDVGHPKAIRAARRLAKINSEIIIEGFHQEITHENFHELFSGCDLIFDGTDNFPTRFMMNRATQDMGLPWIFSGVTASSGQSMMIVPEKTACLGCVIDEQNLDATFPTVHNSGIITSIVTIIASISAITGIKYLIDREIDRTVKFYDAWVHQFSKFEVEPAESCHFCRPDKLRRK
ncbi:MAG: HesA/MoeB/ThiF family protein [Candidatus Rifleibacteriota bacterium]